MHVGRSVEAFFSRSDWLDPFGEAWRIMNMYKELKLAAAIEREAAEPSDTTSQPYQQ